ncbi:hypothetical protein SDC9_61847 [bioreactor metagenome]|uniref:Uncharacterized protein n=1 Tax=bioreactor metagenome TaxID=1076179 RepID=A0A644XGX3_9ZZZZ
MCLAARDRGRVVFHDNGFIHGDYFCTKLLFRGNGWTCRNGNSIMRTNRKACSTDRPVSRFAVQGIVQTVFLFLLGGSYRHNQADQFQNDKGNDG